MLTDRDTKKLIAAFVVALKTQRTGEQEEHRGERTADAKRQVETAGALAGLTEQTAKDLVGKTEKTAKDLADLEEERKREPCALGLTTKTAAQITSMAEDWAMIRSRSIGALVILIIGGMATVVVLGVIAWIKQVISK